MKYNITVNKKQAHILVKALDLMGRICMGQYDEILDYGYLPKSVAADKTHISQYEWQDAKKKLDEIKYLITGQPTSGSYGISSPEVNDQAKEAYDMQQVIRNQLWKDSDKSPRWSTWGSIGFLWTDQPIKIELVKPSGPDIRAFNRDESLAAAVDHIGKTVPSYTVKDIFPPKAKSELPKPPTVTDFIDKRIPASKSMGVSELARQSMDDEEWIDENN